MSKQRKGRSKERTVDWSRIIHPSLKVDNQNVNREVKPIKLTSGCILYGYDVFTYYRIRGLRT